MKLKILHRRKLYLTNMVLKQMINGAKEAINLYYGKQVYTIKRDRLKIK